PVPESAATIDYERFAGTLREQSVRQTILGIFQDREGDLRSARVLGDVLERLARVGIDGQEVDVPHFKSARKRGQSRHVKFADRTGRAREYDDDHPASMFREAIELACSHVPKREIGDDLARSAIEDLISVAEHPQAAAAA